MQPDVGQGGYLNEVISLSSSDDSQAVLVLQAPTGYVADASAELSRQLVSIFGVALCGCLLLGMWLARRISNPVAELIESARRIRRGDYAERIEIDAGGELGILGSAPQTPWSKGSRSGRKRSRTSLFASA